MKKSFFFLLTLAAVATAQADDYPYLTFQTAGGESTSVLTSSLVIPFSGGNLVATASDGTATTLPLSGLSKMYFSASGTTGIEETPAATTDEPVEVFTLAGISLGQYENLKHAQTTLAKGIYVVKSPSRTLKISVR